jgi:hypothetical protein
MSATASAECGGGREACAKSDAENGKFFHGQKRSRCERLPIALGSAPVGGAAPDAGLDFRGIG